MGTDQSIKTSDYLRKVGITYVIFGAIISFCYFSIAFVLLFIIINLTQYSYLGFIIAGSLTILIFCSRLFLLPKIIKKDRLAVWRLIFYIRIASMIISSILFASLFAINYNLVPIPFDIASIIIILFLIITPNWFVFSGQLTETGLLRIYFEQLDKGPSSDDYQYFMKKIFKTLEDDLKEGYIKIDHKKLVYHINKLDPSSTEIISFFDSLRNWLANKRGGMNNIIAMLEGFLSKDDLSYYEKKRWEKVSKFFNLKTMEAFFKLFQMIIFFIALFITTFILGRENILSIIKLLISEF